MMEVEVTATWVWRHELLRVT